MAGPVLILAPSAGLGGGIERYVHTVQWAFEASGIRHHRIDLARPGLAGHLRLLARSAAYLPRPTGPSRVIVAHRALLPAAALLARVREISGISVICHGSDVWGPRTGPRWYAETRLMRRHDVRVVAVSSFTAGALYPGPQAVILPPGLSRTWFDELVSAAEADRAPHRGIELVTAFRLADWQDKGLPELVAAVAALGRADVRLTVCGSGQPSAALLSQVRGYSWCTVRSGLADRELAAQLAAADLFVLPTRTRSGRRASGEGFGLVLLEAQVAGTPVVGPAHGGSAGAYLDGVTGVTPRDESAAALASVLGRLLREPAQLAPMGARAASWARECFDPQRYAALAVDRLL